MKPHNEFSQGNETKKAACIGVYTAIKKYSCAALCKPDRLPHPIHHLASRPAVQTHLGTSCRDGRNGFPCIPAGEMSVGFSLALSVYVLGT